MSDRKISMTMVRTLDDKRSIGFLVVAFIFLFFTNTNLVYVSAGFVFVACGYIFFRATAPATALRVEMWTFLLVAFAILSTAYYSPEAFLDFSFYRRDGNIFISLAPLFCIWFFYRCGEPMPALRLFSILSSGMAFFFYLLFKVRGGTNLLASEDSAIPGAAVDYTYLFIAHNAAGGFLCGLSILTLMMVKDAHQRSDKNAVIVFSILSVIDLWLISASGSRGSLLPIAVVVFFLLGMMHQSKLIYVLLGALALEFIAALHYYNEYPFLLDCFDGRGLITSCLDDLAGRWDVMDIESGRDANIMTRAAMLWPRALDLFFASPIFGVGFGSYNDFPFRPVGWVGVLATSEPFYYVYSDGHAHNSYFHILAEMGAVGLFLVYKLFRSILDAVKATCSGIEYEIVFYLIWGLLLMSLTEHRLVTPSNALPVFIIVSWILAKGSSRPQSVGAV
jgi:O-antigen ligase